MDLGSETWDWDWDSPLAVASPSLGGVDGAQLAHC